MAVKDKDIMFVGAANTPDGDTGTVGGAVDSSKKISWKDIDAGVQVQAVSSSASDTTQTITVHGRNSAGELVSEVITLTGQTPAQAASPLTLNRLLKALKSATCVGTVAVEQTGTAAFSGTATGGGADYVDLPVSASGTDNAYRGMVVRITGGTGAGQVREGVRYDGSGATNPRRLHVRDWATQPDATSVISIRNGMVFDKIASPAIEVDEVRRICYNAAAEPEGGSSVIMFEKVFAMNLHATLALTTSRIQEVTEGIEAGANDFVAFDVEPEDDFDAQDDVAANRLTAPAEHTYTFDSDEKNVRNNGNLSPGKAQGIWLRLTLPAGAEATNSYYVMRVRGQSI